MTETFLRTNSFQARVASLAADLFWRGVEPRRPRLLFFWSSLAVWPDGRPQRTLQRMCQRRRSIPLLLSLLRSTRRGRLVGTRARSLFHLVGQRRGQAGVVAGTNFPLQSIMQSSNLLWMRAKAAPSKSRHGSPQGP